MPKLTPPVAERRKHAATHHGITRQDPYHWLRAENWQEVMQAPETLAPDIRAYLEAENAWFEQEFGKRLPNWLGENERQFAEKRNFCIVRLETLLRWREVVLVDPSKLTTFWTQVHAAQGALADP